MINLVVKHFKRMKSSDRNEDNGVVFYNFWDLNDMQFGTLTLWKQSVQP